MPLQRSTWYRVPPIVPVFLRWQTNRIVRDEPTGSSIETHRPLLDERIANGCDEHKGFAASTQCD